ncbi:acetolactate synthase catalytic subunit [Verticillium alfalfae VaMs.102]|uniref:acetolactate synthase n=1 Tax=Verticillium alfalfae (strain VaMs.102 / ATCC MYA-4576 / FGSC 10136) TaxID=526221 RepID=C9S7Q1_VERA1|nr:acetolactate synthase catalytic subunit [Verticillium alfalfae VaMs.102]EEY15268.1 acetolactate synthase catalytic subunit [Verticillium alfalfae VaMs.102]
MMHRSRQASRALRAVAKQALLHPYPHHLSRRLCRPGHQEDSLRREESSHLRHQPGTRRCPPPSRLCFKQADEHSQPLVDPKAPEMDESFIGKTGGEIFHEMMLRHNVKHVWSRGVAEACSALSMRLFEIATSGPSPAPAATRAAMSLSRKQLTASVKRVADLINIAKKPIIYAGQGVILSENGPEILKELADKASIPVTTTLHGLGGFDELDEKSLHMLGMHGTAYANMAMQEADLIIALGARFDDRVTLNVGKFAPGAKAAAAEGRGGIVHFEIMPKNINKVVQAVEAVEGDVATNVSMMLPHVEIRSMADRSAWFDKINGWKKRWPLSDYERTERGGLIKPQTLIEELSKMTADRKDNTYITTGVGQHQMWTAQHFRWRHPRSMITSGGLGTMGFGLPAAIGAKVAQPDALVIDIDGDASFNMTLTELSTAAQFNIGVKVIVLNNEEQGMVTQWQNLFYEDRYAHTHSVNPDFQKLSDAMGVQSRRLEKPEEIQEALRWLIESDGPALLEVVTDRKGPVLPMVPSGSGLHEFLTWDSERDVQRRKMMRERTGGRHG